MSRHIHHALVSAGCVLLVAGAWVSPGGRYADADRVEDAPSCVVIDGGQACTIPPVTVPPVVATDDPPVPGSRFESGPAPQAPGNDPDPNGYCQAGSDFWPQCGRP